MNNSQRWRARINGPSGQGTVETHDMFGWQIQRHVLPAGAVLAVLATQPVDRSASPNITLHVRGTATCHVNNRRVVDRTPGLYTPERPSYEAGVVRIEAIDEIEYWCVNYLLNRRALPVLTPVRLQPGEVVNLAAGTLFFHMHGELADLEIGEHVPDADVTLTATSPSFSYIVGGRR